MAIVLMLDDSPNLQLREVRRASWFVPNNEMTILIIISVNVLQLGGPTGRPPWPSFNIRRRLLQPGGGGWLSQSKRELKSNVKENI